MGRFRLPWWPVKPEEDPLDRLTRRHQLIYWGMIGLLVASRPDPTGQSRDGTGHNLSKSSVRPSLGCGSACLGEIRISANGEEFAPRPPCIGRRWLSPRSTCWQESVKLWGAEPPRV